MVVIPWRDGKGPASSPHSKGEAGTHYYFVSSYIYQSWGVPVSQLSHNQTDVMKIISFFWSTYDILTNCQEKQNKTSNSSNIFSQHFLGKHIVVTRLIFSDVFWSILRYGTIFIHIFYNYDFCFYKLYIYLCI